MSQLIEMAQTWAQWWIAGIWRASVEGAIAIAVVWIIARWCTFLSPRIVCWLWRVVCLKLLVALIWTQPVAIAILPYKAVATTNVQPTVANTPQRIPVADETPPAVNIQPSLLPPVQSASHITIREALALSWSIGVLCLVAFTMREWLSIRRMCRNAAAVFSPALQQTCQNEAVRLGIRRLPQLRFSSRADGPLLAGIVRPTIILPDNVEAAFDQNDVRLMLAHELVHLKRHDLLWNWLPTVVGWLFFFHPLGWLLRRSWFESQEAACDELLLQNQVVRPSEYGRLLLKLSARWVQKPRASLAAAGVFGAYRNLERRIIAMTRVKAYSQRRLLFAASTFSLIAVVVIIPWRLVAQEQELNTTNDLLKVAERRLLNAIEVKYTLTQHIEGPTPNHPEFEGAPDLVIQRDLLLDLKNLRFEVKRKVFGRDTPQTSDPNDGLIKNVWDGNLFTQYQVGENFADISTHLPNKAKEEALEDWLLRGILVYPPTPGGFGVDDGSLISLLRRGHLRKGSEEIDGRPCCVVESTDFGRQWVVWLDIERSLAPLKIQTLLDKEVHQEWHLTDFVKLSGDGQDFWFPMKLDLTDRNGKSVIQRQIIVDRDVTKINPTISDASLHLDFPRGTVVYDEAENATHMIGQNKSTK